MKDPDHEERSVIEGARRAFAPTSRDAGRVWQGTQQALGLAPSGSAVDPAAAQAGGTPPVLQPQAAAAGATAGAGWLTQSLAALCIAAVSGAGGYYAGHRARPEPGGTGTPAPAVERPAPGPAETRGAEPGIASPDMAAEPEPETVVAAPGAVPPPAGKPSSQEENQPFTSSRVRSLQGEIATLRRVELALRAGKPSLALSLLGDLDREVPGGALGEERAAAATIARCALQPGSAPDLLRRFTRLHPQSVYLKRVRQSCTAEAGSAEGSR